MKNKWKEFIGEHLLSKKSVIYLIKVNYTLYNYAPCNSTWTCLYNVPDFDRKTKRYSWYWRIFFFCQTLKLCRNISKNPFLVFLNPIFTRDPIVPSSSRFQVCQGSNCVSVLCPPQFNLLPPSLAIFCISESCADGIASGITSNFRRQWIICTMFQGGKHEQKNCQSF